MKCQPANTLPQAAFKPRRIGRSCQSSASDAACFHPISAFGLPSPQNSVSSLSPIRGNITHPRTRPFLSVGTWNSIGNRAQAGLAPVKPGKTKFIDPCSNHACSKPLPINTRPHRVKPSKTKSITIAMSEPLPIPGQPQPTPFPSAVRCEIFVVPIPNSNLSPIRGGIFIPRARRCRPAGTSIFVGNGTQAGHAPVKPGKTKFTAP